MSDRSLGCNWRVVVKDSNGKIVRRTSGENSLLLAFAQIIRSSMARTSDTIKCIDGTSRTMSWTVPGTGTEGEVKYAGFDLRGLDDDDTVGIVIGTGTTAVQLGDYKLEAQIAHGTDSGEMEYDLGYFDDVEVGTSEVTQTLTRTFANESGDSITVNEIGMYASFFDTSGVQHSVGIIRDIISPIIVEDTYSVTVQYDVFIGV